MARYVFPSGSVSNSTGAPIVLQAYRSSTSTKPLLDLHSVDGSGDPGLGIYNGEIITTTGGSYSSFYGPEGLSTVYLEGTGVPRFSVSSSAAVTANAWQFKVSDYGAKGDGIVVNDIATTNGSGVITSASGKFTSAHVGKKIMINGAIGSTNIPLVATISSYQSATQVTLGSNATVTTTGLHGVWGTDDTAAIQAALDAAKAYAESHEFYAEVLFDDKKYCLYSGPTQTTSPNYNTQLKFPSPTNNVSRKLEIAMIGVSDNSHLQFWQSTVPSIMGTSLISFLTNAPSTIDSTYGVQSVVGAPTGNVTFSGSFPNLKAVIRNIAVWCPAYTNMTAWDFDWAAGLYMDGCSAHIFATPLQGGGVLLNNLPADVVFQGKIGTGLRTPVVGNNADVWIPSFASEGYSRGIYASEHVRIGNLKTIYNDVAMIIDVGSGLTNQSHGVVVEGWTAEVYNGGLTPNGTGICHVDIRVVTENSASAYDISDTNNVLRGKIEWVNVVDARNIIVTGASKVKVCNTTTNGPGKWASQPSVPASTTAQQNTSWRDAAVTITGGTVTVINVDGTATGLTSGTVIVPAGKNITLTYSVAPSWNWWLL